MIISKEFLINLFSFSWNDLKKRYAGSMLGVFWTYVQTFSTVAIYWFVFQFGLKAGPVNGVPFLPWFITGLMPWLLFSEIINSSITCLFEYSYIVKKIVFNVAIIPLSRILTALYIYVFFGALVLGITILYKVFTGFYALYVIYYLICLLVLAFPITFFVCTVSVFVRDLAHLIGIVLNLLMWATPIVWDVTILPEKIQSIFKLNPMFYVINGFRDALIYGGSNKNTILYTVYFWIVAIVLNIIGFSVYKKLVPHLADVI